jgi:hypothetical protein
MPDIYWSIAKSSPLELPPGVRNYEFPSRNANEKPREQRARRRWGLKIRAAESNLRTIVKDDILDFCN